MFLTSKLNHFNGVLRYCLKDINGGFRLGMSKDILVFKQIFFQIDLQN